MGAYVFLTYRPPDIYIPDCGHYSWRTFSGAFHAAGCVYGVTKQTVAWHL